MLDLLNHAGPALSFVLQVPTLGILLLGIMLGIVLGALPGFGSSQSMALLFPMTFAMSPEHAILFFIAVYSAAEYGGSVPAILIRTPGTPAQSVTVLDGYAMTRKGLAGKALKISLISGVLGGIISTLIFMQRRWRKSACSLAPVKCSRSESLGFQSSEHSSAKARLRVSSPQVLGFYWEQLAVLGSAECASRSIKDT